MKICICNLTHSYFCHDSFMRTRTSEALSKSVRYVRHDSFISTTCRIRTCHRRSQKSAAWDMTRSRINDETWLIHIWDMSHVSYMKAHISHIWQKSAAWDMTRSLYVTRKKNVWNDSFTSAIQSILRHRRCQKVYASTKLWWLAANLAISGIVRVIRVRGVRDCRVSSSLST